MWIYKDPHETLDEFAARTEPSRVWEVSERDDMAGGIAVNLLAAKPDDPMGWLTRRQTMLMVRFPQAVDEVVEMCHIVRAALEAGMADLLARPFDESAQLQLRQVLDSDQLRRATQIARSMQGGR
mgnify:CR=1 FL=1